MTYTPSDFGLDKNGPQFGWLDQRLTLHGFPPTRLMMNLKDRVQKFQLAQGWSGTGADGLVGPTTLSRLTADPKPPSASIDLSKWKLTLPTPLGGDSPQEIKQPALLTFELPPYFDRILGSAIAFRAPVDGAHTPNSSYPRSELRELKPDGSLANWSTSSGTNEMVIEQAITAVPGVKPHVVAGQIHDASDDVVMIRLEGKRLFVESGGDEVKVLTENYVLGTRFRIVIHTDSTGIYVHYNGVGGRVLTGQWSGCYFKAGCYTQANKSNGTGYGEVVIYQLTVKHS